MLILLLGPRIVIAVAKWWSAGSRNRSSKKTSPIIERLKRFAQSKLNEGFDAVVLAHTHLPEEIPMKKSNRKQRIAFGALLILLSVLFYTLHFVFFKDSHHIFIYLVGDIAFVPIEVLLVTMIIHKLLDEREKRMKFKKLNMVIETFYSEVGTRLLAWVSDSDPELESKKKDLMISNEWSNKDFKNIKKRFAENEYKVNISEIDLQGLTDYLVEKRTVLLQLLQTPYCWSMSPSLISFRVCFI